MAGIAPGCVLHASRAREWRGPEREQRVVLPAQTGHRFVVHGVASWRVEDAVPILGNTVLCDSIMCCEERQHGYT